MPAFGPTHKDEEIWKVVAFVQRLPTVTRGGLREDGAPLTLQVHGCVESSHSLAWKTPFRSASRRTRSTNYLFCGGEFSRSAVMDGIRE